MFVGKVIGTVWSTVKWPQVQGLKLLVVRPYHLADLASRDDLAPAGASGASGAPDNSPNPAGGPDSEAVICVDLLDAGVGDDVVVAFGHAARVAAQSATQSFRSEGGRQKGSTATNAQGPKGISPAFGQAASAIVPIDAAVVAIVDSIAVARPRT